MADAVVERRPAARFFCHRCNIEFEDVLQDYTCPYCAGGFIEQLEGEAEGSVLSGDDFSDADMSNLDDSDEMHQSASLPALNDLAFLMSGGRVRGNGRPETLLEHLVWTIGGGGPPGGGAVTAGAPFVFVGAPGDYVFGGEGLDAVVTQLLGQLENAGPPPLPRDQIAAIPSEAVSPEQAAANASCSVCWESFQQGEMVSRLECDHIFHSTCIEPWLQLHATCPICRRSLLERAAGAAPAPGAAAPPPPPPADGGASTPTRETSSSTDLRSSLPRVLLRRLPRRAAGALQTHTWDSPADSGSSGSVSAASAASAASSVTAGGVWAPLAAAPAARSATDTSSASSASLDSSDRERHYNMDIDFD